MPLDTDTKKLKTDLSKFFYSNVHGAFDKYMIFLKSKNSYENLRDNTFDYTQTPKYQEWLRNGWEDFCLKREVSMNALKEVANQMSEKDLAKLHLWIKNDPLSHKAWKKKLVTIFDDKEIIMARFLHTIFMAKTNDIIKIGDLISKHTF